METDILSHLITLLFIVVSFAVVYVAWFVIDKLILIVALLIMMLVNGVMRNSELIYSLESLEGKRINRVCDAMSLLSMVVLTGVFFMGIGIV